MYRCKLTDVTPGPAALGCRARQVAACGQQAGVMHSKYALPPLIPAGLDADTHFQQALDFMSVGVFPYDAEAPAPLDLRFAVQQTLRRTRNSKALFSTFRSKLQELAHRCSHHTSLIAVSAHLSFCSC
eukprot:6472724-Amphidinium_carterae.1